MAQVEGGCGRRKAAGISNRCRGNFGAINIEAIEIIGAVTHTDKMMPDFIGNRFGTGEGNADASGIA